MALKHESQMPNVTFKNRNNANPMKLFKSHLFKNESMFLFDDDPAGQPGAVVEDPNPNPNPAPSGPSFDPAAIARELGSVIQQNQPKAPPTPEEIAAAKRALNVWEPDDTWFANFDNLDKRKDAIMQMRDGLFGQAFTAAQRLYAEREQAILERMSPMERAYFQQQESAVMGRIGQIVPALAQPEYKPIVDKVIAHFHTTGQKFNNEAELAKAIAKGVEEVARVSNPSFVLPAGAAQPNPPAKNQPGALPTTSSGSGGGGGRSSGASNANKPKAVQLLEG